MPSIPTGTASAASHKPAANGGAIPLRAAVQADSDARVAADLDILDPESLAYDLLQRDKICREDLFKLLHSAVSRLPESQGKIYSGMREPGATADVLHDTCTHCPSVIRALSAL